MDDLGVPLVLETPKYEHVIKILQAHNRKNNLEVTNLGPWSPSPDMQNDDPNLGDFLP